MASMLVKTQDEGKTSVGELAANMGRVIPSAAAYNVSLENLTTAYAILTKSGTNTAISTTNLGAMFDELAKNGSNVAGILEEQTGKSFSELMASGSNLGDIMAILSESVDGDATAFSNLWSSTTAGKAALSLLNAGAEEFDRTLGVMANSSGSVERNFQIMADTTEFAHQRMTNAAENLKIAVGDQLNPALEKLYITGGDAFTWAADFVNENPATVKAIAAVTVGLGTLATGVTLATNAENIMAVATGVDELTAAQEENAAQIAELEEASREYGEKQAEAAAKTQEMTSRVEDITAKMETLQAAYEESYNAAMESIDGQLGLFNELDGSAKTSIDNLIGTLQGQVSYMETYAANIQKAMELGVDEGLIRKLSDGSEESAQILAAIVEGGEEDIAALNEQLAKVEEGKEAFSETVAEMETDFSDQMEELVRDLDDAIQDMDLSDDAYQIGENNMQGLIDGTASKKAELVRKYAEMGRAALAAYKKEVEQASPSKKFNEAGRFDIQGIIKGAEAEKANLAETYADAGRTALSAMEKSLPSSVEEPPTSAAINRQTAAIVAAVRGRDGGTPGGIAIYVDKLEVRDDQDVERVARELYYLAERESRSRGGSL